MHLGGPGALAQSRAVLAHRSWCALARPVACRHPLLPGFGLPQPGPSHPWLGSRAGWEALTGHWTSSWPAACFELSGSCSMAHAAMASLRSHPRLPCKTLEDQETSDRQLESRVQVEKHGLCSVKPLILLSALTSVQGKAMLWLLQWPTCRRARMIASGSWKITRLSTSSPRSRRLALPSPLQNNHPFSWLQELSFSAPLHINLFVCFWASSKAIKLVILGTLASSKRTHFIQFSTTGMDQHATIHMQQEESGTPCSSGLRCCFRQHLDLHRLPCRQHQTWTQG